MQVWKAQIGIVGDSWLDYWSIIDDVLDLWTTAATIRRAPTATHQWINIYRSLQHARLRRRQNRTVYAVLNRKQNLRSTYCSETNDRHEARAASLRQLSYLLSRVSILTRDIDIAILSVRRSVCPSRSGIRWKRLNIWDSLFTIR